MSIKRALAKVALALCIALPTGPAVLVATATPAVAHHADGDQGGMYWCYEYDVHVGTHTDWHGGGWGWRTQTYERWRECTYDGSWYWQDYLYTWSEGYWVREF